MNENNQTPSAVQTALAEIDLIETGYMGADLLIFSLNLPQIFNQEYYAKAGNKSFECTRQEELPDRLYCFGQSPEQRSGTVFELYNLTNDELIWKTEFNFPDMDE